ncbi:MAG TPA: YHS domain-containing protein [Candidatus Thermoplasmatota archaeon]|nr:YHS domain-containing protein [Candidatus Thermoplasmatota archaeon]
MTPETVKDLVCGMDLGTVQEAVDLGAETAEHAGKTYYFCCPMCKESFLKKPAVFIARGEGNPGLTGSHSH